MAIQAIISGRASEPRINQTQTGKQVMSFGLAATPRRKDQATGEWVDHGEPLWVEVTLWEQDVERWRHLIGKGTQVTVSAGLALESFTGRDGTAREKLMAVSPRVLGIVPREGAGGSFGAPNGSQWGTASPGAFEAPRNDSVQSVYDDTTPPF